MTSVRRLNLEAASLPARASILLTGLVMALLLQAGRLESQTSAEFQSRVDSLRADWELKRREFLNMAEALAPKEIDTITAGPFTVFADATIGKLMEQAVPIAWEVLCETLRFDSMLATAKPLYFPSGGSRRIRRSTDVATGPLIGDSWDVEAVVSRIIQTVGNELGTMLQDSTRLWLGANILSPTAAKARGWSGSNLSWVYVELATSGSAVGRRCFTGNLTACSSALQLEPASDPILEWYDDQDRRRFVARTGVSRRWGTAEEWIHCVEEGYETACESLFRTRFEGSVHHPVSPVAHQTLAQIALQMGGDGAYGRMVRTDASTIADWIAVVAGAPVDSVVARWHSDVLAARPAPTTLTAAAGWGAAAWIVVLVAIASRSTRWRS
ncbi:MAG: hypothetical protein JSW71_03060 [Gemmatimonadota bacterium]|nr:MAG: hypothetical protein JSW71_03060 [Gemmatimonadota bacterium]